MQEDSIAVLKVYSLTTTGSQMFFSFISAISPKLASIPKNFPSGFECFDLNSVSTFTTLAPQF